MPGLIGIGVGPGDPDLLTVKAVKAIQNADIIMCPASKEERPSIALSVIDSIIDKSKKRKNCVIVNNILNLYFPFGVYNICNLIISKFVSFYYNSIICPYNSTF